MTAATVGWLIAGICLVGFVTLWFTVSYRELSTKYKSLESIKEQVQIHRILYMQERGGENDAVAKHVLENKLMVYQDVEKDYNAMLKRIMNRIPSYFMGFRPAGMSKDKSNSTIKS
jgi:hypothetical protein